VWRFFARARADTEPTSLCGSLARSGGLTRDIYVYGMPPISRMVMIEFSISPSGQHLADELELELAEIDWFALCVMRRNICRDNAQRARKKWRICSPRRLVGRADGLFRLLPCYQLKIL